MTAQFRVSNKGALAASKIMEDSSVHKEPSNSVCWMTHCMQRCTLQLAGHMACRQLPVQDPVHVLQAVCEAYQLKSAACSGRFCAAHERRQQGALPCSHREL